MKLISSVSSHAPGCSLVHRHARRCAVSALALAAASLSVSVAAAEPGQPAAVDRDRFGLGGKVFFGGDVDFEVDDFDQGESEAITTLGLFTEYEHPLHQNFALGGEVGLSWWNAEVFDDRNVDKSLLLTLLAQPKLRHATVVEGGRLLELYAVVPIGMNVNFSEIPDVDTGVGFSVGLSGGVSYWLWPSAALMADFGFMSHSINGESGNADVSASFLQFGFSGGLQFAL